MRTVLWAEARKLRQYTTFLLFGALLLLVSLVIRV